MSNIFKNAKLLSLGALILILTSFSSCSDNAGPENDGQLLDGILSDPVSDTNTDTEDSATEENVSEDEEVPYIEGPSELPNVGE